MKDIYNLIIPYLYIGGKNAMTSDIRFSTIINCTPNVPCPNYCKNCIRIPVGNSKKDCNKFFNIITKTDVLHQIHTSIQKKIPVLIHCMEGMHRSCTLAACYFMKYNNMNIKDAMAFVKSKRSVAFNRVYNLFCVIQMYYNYLHSKPKQPENVIKEKQPENVIKEKQVGNVIKEKQPENVIKDKQNNLKHLIRK
jgi:hypothetical protein